MTAPSFWTEDHPLFPQYKELYDKLVSASSNAETEEGEMLRAVSRLGYDYYNNGMCNNTSGAAKYLIEQFDEHGLGCDAELQRLYLYSNTGTYVKADLDAEVTTVTAAVVEHILKQNGFYLASADDLFDWQDPDYYPDDEDDEDEDQDYWGDED